MSYSEENGQVVLSMSQEADIIKCISLWQPWAEAMRRKLKKNETRSWGCGHRGWLAIHAAKKKFNPNDYDPEFAHECRRLDIWPDRLTYGAVVCIVRMVGCEKTERVRDQISEQERFWGNYDVGRYAWITSPLDMIELPEPIPLRGHQGLFEWEPPTDILNRLNSGNPHYTPYEVSSSTKSDTK